MPDIQKLRNIKFLSINEIVKRTCFCWETVKKYADEEQLLKKREPNKRGMMYEGKQGENVSDWLTEDYVLKKV